MHLSIVRSGIILALAALGISTATAQTELFFATGVDSTGRAQAQSNADGHVLIESPQYPRGLWLHLIDETGNALDGIRVEYQGQPDSLVTIHCVDPAGGLRETLVWTRPDGTPLRLTLKSKESADLPMGLASIDWRINPNAEFLLEPIVETRLIGWTAVVAFLQERWQGQTGRIAVQFDTSTLAVEVDHPEAIEALVAHLQQAQQPADVALGEINSLEMQVFAGNLGLQEGVILLKVSLFDDSNLEEAVRQALGRVEEVSFLDSISAVDKSINSLAGIEYFAGLRSLDLKSNRIVDITPLNQLINLNRLYLGFNRIVDITPLNQLENLNWLDLDWNRIVDLDPLKQSNNLNRLWLSNNRIADITPLNQLINLRELSLHDNQIADITPLKRLTHLNRLYLSFNQIADITPLNQLKNLKELTLGYNRIVDLPPLNQLINLEAVWLSNNQIADITPLNQLTLVNLSGLILSNNQIVDITPLSQMTNLQWIYLDNNQITDLSPLVANTGLGKSDNVFLRGNPLSDQARKEQIPALEARGVYVAY